MTDRTSNASAIAALVAEAPGDGDCVGLQEALRSCTEFTVASHAGEIPAGQRVPIPVATFCGFTLKAWGELEPHEREAFRLFYSRVGDQLEGIAEGAGRGDDLDEVAWQEITAGLRDD